MANVNQLAAGCNNAASARKFGLCNCTGAQTRPVAELSSATNQPDAACLQVDDVIFAAADEGATLHAAVHNMRSSQQEGGTVAHAEDKQTPRSALTSYLATLQDALQNRGTTPKRLALCRYLLLHAFGLSRPCNCSTLRICRRRAVHPVSPILTWTPCLTFTLPKISGSSPRIRVIS